MLFLTLGIGVIHHNHTHLRMWRGRWANRATDFWITLLQGHPTFVFYPAHVANHHRYKHGPDDQARTYRFGGDTNHLWGYLIHPAQAVWVLYPLFFTWLGRLRRHWPGAWRYCMAQYGAAGPVGGSAGAESGQGAGVRDRAAAARPALAAGHQLPAARARRWRSRTRRGAELCAQFRGPAQSAAVQHRPAHRASRAFARALGRADRAALRPLPRSSSRRAE